jgi:putative ATP-binding cassette transporter
MKRVFLVVSSLHSLLRKYRGQFIVAAIASVAAGLCSSGILAVVNCRLKGVVVPYLPVPALFALLVAIYLSASLLAELLHLRIAEAELANLRFQLSKQILNLPLRRLETIGSGNLFASLTSDLDKIILIIVKIPSFILNVSTAVGCGIYIVLVSPKVAAMILVYLAGSAVLYVVPFRLSERYIVTVRENWDDLCRSFHSVTQGAKELLMHHHRRRSFLMERIQRTCGEIQRNMIKGKSIHNFAYRWGDTLYFIGLGGFLFLAAPYLALPNKDLTSIIWALLYMVIPIHFVINWGPNFQDIVISIQKLNAIGFSFDYDEADEDIAGAEAPIREREGHPLLQLTGVRYTYFNQDEEGSFAVGPLTLTLQRNQIIFLTGGNGSGKTTLMKIICGLYSPESGEIRWNGEPIDDSNRSLYRQFFSVVFSDFYLFDELFGLDKSHCESRAETYLHRLKLNRKVSLNEGKLSTIDLSQGQRKRIALLVAFLEDRPFYIFDEWAADQDPVFKRIFYHEILPDLRSRQKTVLVISHDEAYYHVADRLIKLEDGHLKEENVAGEAGRLAATGA